MHLLGVDALIMTLFSLNPAQDMFSVTELCPCLVRSELLDRALPGPACFTSRPKKVIGAAPGEGSPGAGRGAVTAIFPPPKSLIGRTSSYVETPVLASGFRMGS